MSNFSYSKRTGETNNLTSAVINTFGDEYFVYYKNDCSLEFVDAL